MSSATTTTAAAPPPEAPRTTPWVWASTAARVVLAAVWAWAAVTKIGDPAASVRAVRAYDLLPEWLAKAVGYGLPFLELSLAVLLLAGLATRLAAVASAALLAVFLVGIVSAAARGLQIECGCFGGGGSLEAGRSTAYTTEIVRDVALLLVSLFLVRWTRSRWAADDAVRNSVRVPEGRIGPRKSAQARKRLAELAERRRVAGEKRARAVTGVAGLAIVAVTAAGIGIQGARIPTPTGPTPAGVSLADGVTVGQAGAKVTLDVWEDPQCPVCKDFEDQVGPTIAGWVADGTVKVRYHVISFLDGQSTTKYSSRASNALYAAAEVSPAVFVKYHDLLFARQPAEGSAGLTDDELVSLAKEAGAGTVEAAIRDGRFGDYVGRATEQSSKDGVTGTPAVRVDGRAVDNPTRDAVKAAVEAAG